MTNIYLITNLITGQKYVGKTVNTIQHRFRQHYTDMNNTYIDNAMKAYGIENFECTLLKECEDSEWKYWETYYIEELNSHWTKGGYNLSMGGDYNPMDDPEVRQRHKSACSSPEHIEKLRKAALGKRHTEESKKKMSKIQKELYKNPELRQKVKLNQPTRIPVAMLDENENIIKTFDTLTDACRYFNKNQGNTSAIHQVLDKYNKNGKRAKFWGHAWIKLDKEV